MGERDKASSRGNYCGGEVAASGCSGGRGTREAGQRGKARAAGKVGVTRGEGRQQEVDRRWPA
jgi:hypothetical protein